jgi:REP element-mobilizing transposase RayT
MSQSLAQIYVHIIFSTKNRLPFLVDCSFRSRLHAYLAGICNNQGSPSLQTGGIADHVHILCRLSKTGAVSDLIRDLKRDSTNWVKQENSALHDFHWQNGYGAFSVSAEHVGTVTGYIQDQESHHASESFQDEFRRFCKKCGAVLDERYAWD